MHVNNIQSQPSIGLHSLSQPPVKELSSSWKGRSAVLIQDNANSNHSIMKLADAAHEQFQQINQNASSISSKSISIASKQKPALECPREQQTELTGIFADMLGNNPSKCLYLISRQNGKNIAKNVNHEDLKNAPLPQGARIIAAFEHEGRLIVPNRKNDELEIDEIHDENGQVREFQSLDLDDDLYSQFQEKLEVHVNKFIEMKFAQTSEKTEIRDEHDKSQSALPERVNNIRNRVLEIKTDDQGKELKEDKSLEQNLGVFTQIFSTILKHVEAEKAKEKEEIELERKNLDKKHIILQKSIKLFDLFQERIKVGSESEAIAFSEQNHMRAVHSFKPIDHAKTMV